MSESPIQTIIASGKPASAFYGSLAEADVLPETRRFVEEYVGIAPDQIVPYLTEFRDALWAVYPWPCVGRFIFVRGTLREQPSYARVKDVVRAGGRYLDVGCAAGQDLRYLVHDAGCASDNFYGLDKMDGFIDAAYRYFRDRDTLKATFIVDDFMAPAPGGAADRLLGTVDVLHAGMFLHVWGLEDQHRACERIVALLRPRPGALAIGNSVARRVAAAPVGPEGTVIYKHNEASFRAMWEEVGRRTGTRWAVRARNTDLPKGQGAPGVWEDPAMTRLFWEVERL